jgi:nucleotide-binding universal stress UspA family protein
MKILIASKPSSHAKRAAQYGYMLTKLTKAEATIVHVIQRPDEREEGNTFLKTQNQATKKIGLTVDLVLRVGRVSEQIVHLAYEGEFDLIVLGVGSRETLLRRELTPTNEKILANAPCPVLIAKGETEQIENLLVLHSGQEGQGTILRFLEHAGKLIRKNSKVTLLHVMSQIGAGYRVEDWELRAEASELVKARTLEGSWLSEGVKALEYARKVKVAPRVRHGFVIDEILREVEQGDYDIVVLGSHRKGGWTEFLVDNIAKQVISRVNRPVLVVQGE